MHPYNCDGAHFFGNSKAQECFAKMTGLSYEVTTSQPVTSSIPQVSVLINGKWKARAMIMVDS